MTDRSVRWGRTCRALAVASVGLVAVPTVLAAAASADPGPVPKPLKGSITVLQDLWGDHRADRVSKGTDGTYQAEQDPGSLFTITKAIGARAVWSQKDQAGRAITGQGVAVALLDSGLAAVPGLDAPGKVVAGPDLSLQDNNEPLAGLDGYGHGTHLGAIIAGADSTERDAKTGEPKGLRADQQLGVAPDATLLALKLATRNGSTDVSQVIAGLDWVAQHKDDNGMHVRVVNLSFGTDSLQPYQLDPLAAAAENAWRHGLVVVVSGGNEGQQAGRLTDPAIDPYVISVGASDPELRVDGWKSPVVASFSSGGNILRHVDLLAPGRSVTSLRAPGSFIDVEHPEGLVAGDTTGRLFRGSGTSQAAAVVSGAAALLLQANPSLNPDQVKAALVDTAHPLARVSPVYQGAGELNITAAVATARAVGGDKAAQSTGRSSTEQSFPRATGLGSLEAARGGSNLVDPQTGVALRGEVDVQGQSFDAATWAPGSAAGTAWSGGRWNNARWSGDGWSSARWSDARWSNARWSNARWSNARWSNARWSNARWSDADWS